MIVPQYWAEGRVQHIQERRQITVRRFGWSDISQEDAQANADARSREALSRLLSGERISRRERKRSYEGEEGVPIREEIVERHDDTIITRNSYGARCLNTPDVFFADIDFMNGTSLRYSCAVMALFMIYVPIILWAVNSWSLRIVFLLAFAILGTQGYKIYQRARGGPENIARSRIKRFLDRHPDWNLRLYRTPAGMRVLATHKTFSPNDPAVAECFKALGTDRLYVRLCQKQQCFRARVSAKPWRIGIDKSLRGGIWPIAPEKMIERQMWVERYEAAARPFSACRLIETMGSGVVHPHARPVQELHDELCQATKEQPLA